MNIHNDKYNLCILCKGEPKYGDNYFVRTDVKSVVTDYLKKFRHIFNICSMSSLNWPRTWSLTLAGLPECILSTSLFRGFLSPQKKRRTKL